MKVYLQHAIDISMFLRVESLLTSLFPVQTWSGSPVA